MSETTRGRGKQSGSLTVAALSVTAASLLLLSPYAHAGPEGGQVVSGSGSISASASNGQSTTTINQASDRLSINWQSFNVGKAESVNFVQPSASALAVNRILDTQGSQILGRINANGQVWLINPNGVLFGKDAQINVGGLLASTLNPDDASIGSTRSNFSGSSTAGVVNLGSINAAQGGYVALLGHSVTNQGRISAPGGTVALGAGSAVSLNFAGSKLLGLEVTSNQVNALAENGGLIQADGGQVLLSAGARESLLASVVNNTGIIQARTVQEQEGKIILLGGMAAGTTKVAGTLDASAPNGGNGGFIETSAYSVKVDDSATITTASAQGKQGQWLIDPFDFYIAASTDSKSNITGAALSTALGSNDVTIQTVASGDPTVTGPTSPIANGPYTGTNGDIFVNDAVTWASNKTLTLSAYRNININSAITASAGGLTLTAGYNDTNQGAISVPSALAVGAFNLTRGTWTQKDLSLPSFSATSFQLSGGTFIRALGGDGSVASPFQITDVYGLQGIGSSSTTLKNHYALANNVDASGTSTWNLSSGTFSGFAPIGPYINNDVKDVNKRFSGSFDGLGHTISGLTINRPATPFVGLFGYITNSVIKNVGVTSASVVGNYHTGILAGFTHGTTSNSYSTGSVISSGPFGGLVGGNDGTISNSYSSANLSGTGAMGGGLVGLNYRTVTNSYATGSVTGSGGVRGGLVGRNAAGVADNGTITESTISNSYATGAVSGSYNIGGLVGEVQRVERTVSGNLIVARGTITNSYATGAVSATGTSAGGLAGSNGGNISNSYANGAVSATDVNAGGLVGWSSGTVSGSYATGSVSGSGGIKGGLVGRNTDLATISNSYATGAVSGSYAIGGLVGDVLRAVSATQVVTSGTVSDSYATGAVTATGGDAGGLIGWSKGMVSSSYATGRVSGTGKVGGLAGYSGYGTFINSYATGLVSGLHAGGLVGYMDNSGAISSSYATGSVTGTNSTGGLLGQLFSGTISNAYATGAVSGGTNRGGLIGQINASGGYSVSNAYATGAVTSGTAAGGLVGLLTAGSTGSISNSFFDTGTTGRATGVGSGSSTGVTVLATANAFTQGSYGGLDFTNTWYMVNGATRPFLRSQWSTTVRNTHQLQLMGMNLSSNYTLANSLDLSADLANKSSMWKTSADFSSDNGFAPIGTFTRSFDGKGYTITGLTINRATTDNVGLFSVLGTGGVVKDLGLVNAGVVGQHKVGGLVGTSQGSISNSYATGSVSGKTYVGGLVGRIENGSISSSYAAASVTANGKDIYNQTFAGGLVGRMFNGSISSSYATGNVNGSGSGSGDFVGGLVGFIYSGTLSSSYATGIVNGSGDYVGGLLGGNRISFSSSYATGSVSGSNYVGGLVGMQVEGTLSGSYATGIVSGAQAVGGLVGFNAAQGIISGSYASTSASVSGTNFIGGLVGYNLGTINSSSYAARSVSGTNFIGGLAGFNSGTISSSYATGDISASGGLAGGLVGHNSFSTDTNGNVTSIGAISTSYATGPVTGSFSVGGLVGYNDKASISNTYATGTVTGAANDVGGLLGYNTNNGSVSSSYATGSVTAPAGTHVGGLLGQNISGTISSSYFDKDTTGQTSGVGFGITNGDTVQVTGLITSDMKKSAKFAGFDSTSTWFTYDGYTNPLLRTFLTSLIVTYTVSGSKTYDGTTDGGTINSVATTGTLTSGKNLLGTPTAVLSSKNAGTVTATGGGLYSNQQGYLITASTTGPGTVTITPKALSANLAAQTKTYDGNTTATWTSGAITASGFANGEGASVTQTSGAYNDKNVVGANSVTATLTSSHFSFNSGVLASNYALPTSVTGTGSITPKALSATASASNKVYDGNTTAAATLAITQTGFVGQETVTATGAAAFNSKNVNEANLVTVNSTALANGNNGGLASNYSLAAGQTAAASITPKALSATASASNKVYDGNTTAAATLVISSGLVGQETVTATGAATFNSKNVTEANLVTINSTALANGDNGGLASNYSLATGQTAAATITKATLTYTANPASSNTGNAPTGLSGTVGGFVKDENQNTATTGTLAWTTPATSASSAGSYAINGSGLNANNYSFSQAAGNSTALTLTVAQTTSIEPVVIATPRPSNTSLPKIEQAAQNTPPLVSQAAGNSAGNSSGNSAASTLTQAASRVQTTSFVPVITPPSLFSNTSFARSAQLAQNTQPLSDSIDINSLSPAGAGTEEETTENTKENGEENASRPTGSTGMLNTKATGL